MVWLKRIRIRNSLPAFTIVEIIITLTITLTLTLLGVVQLKTYNQRLILDNTTKEVKSSIEQAARISAIRHQAIIIRYYPVSKSLILIGKKYYRELKVANDIEIYNLPLLQISPNGSLPAHTITITNHKNIRKIKLQMTWGRPIDDT
ncbi:hypothetical protein [Lactobacillus sp. ESL0230]|uniref:hypothetical protein n=1 Tax=Lactobacillus sp. ESL0230 TaxID=2069353 RepID=UPI000EFB52A8|nr:hypothetical protein [Lactobacillus sp. ESL0230]RMC46233.1 hypothetical protein F5ESL0230_02960 [Lactobacillus sp. ESL0230]